MSEHQHATENLIDLLVKRGYFHDGLETPLAEVEHAESVEGMKRARKSKRDAYSETDDACWLMSSLSNGFYCTRSKLWMDLLNETRACGGRLSLKDAAIILGVDVSHVKRMASSIESENGLQVVGGELITEEYMDELMTGIVSQLSLATSLRVSHLAEFACLPKDLMSRLLSDRISQKVVQARIVSLGGVKEVVSPMFEDLQLIRVRSTLASLTAPSSLDSVCADMGWEPSFVIPIVRHLCEKSEVPGELHESASSSSGAMYVPKFYIRMQRKSVDDYFSLNGFISAETSQSMGLAAPRMGDFVKESFPDAVSLPHSVINVNVIVSPLEIAVGECISSKSFVDLKFHLPVDYSNTSDIGEIVNSIVLPKLGNPGANTCLFLAVDGEALFFSGGMIEDIRKQLIPLVEAYGKSRADELHRLEEAELSKTASKGSRSMDSEDSTGESGKAKVKARRRATKKAAGAKRGKESSVDCDFGVVPLCVIARDVARKYPDLAEIQEMHGPLFEGTEQEAPVWNSSGESEEAITGGPIYEFCRVALFTSSLRESCHLAVQAELDRLKAIKEAFALSSRKDGAAKIRSIEHAFEDSFPATCNVVLMLSKFIDYTASLDVDEGLVSDLKKDFLRGCAADFVWRITEYCLFKNDVREGVFVFHQTRAASVSSQPDETLPAFCKPMDASTSFFPGVILSCTPGDDGVAREPLPMIRKLLSGNVGVSLARMWSFCGGDCYQGGTKVSEDGLEYTRSGDYDGFLRIAKDSCLTICGLPFKQQLDRKSEKQMMFMRRQELTKRLEEASDANVILDTTVMLLFQQVKQMAVCGKHLSGIILRVLTREKKIPGAVSSLLTDLADCLHRNEKVETELLDAVKTCGLCRDISKHEV